MSSVNIAMSYEYANLSYECDKASNIISFIPMLQYLLHTQGFIQDFDLAEETGWYQDDSSVQKHTHAHVSVHAQENLEIRIVSDAIWDKIVV